MEKINLVWLQGQGCSGCTVSLTNSSHPAVTDVLLGIIDAVSGINLVFHPTVMAEWGEDAVNILRDVEKGKYDPFVLILEGAVPDEAKAGEGFWCMVGEDEKGPITLNYWIDSLSKKAAATVAVGACASYGGIPHGNPNPTGAKGLLDYLGREYKSALGLPVVCIPGCPPAGDWITQTLGALVLAVRGLLPIPELDENNRPKFLFGTLAHDNCPRAGFYSEGKFSEVFGEEFCVVSLGCKGLISHCIAPREGWVNHVGGCPNLGAPCIGCTEPEFPDKPFGPFLEPVEGVTLVKTVIKRILGGIDSAYKVQKAYKKVEVG